MTQKEQLYYLLKAFKKGEYDVQSFCEAYYDIYYPDTPRKEMNVEEFEQFDNLANIVARYSPFEEDRIACPNAFFTDNDVNKVIIKTCNKLGI